MTSSVPFRTGVAVFVAVAASTALGVAGEVSTWLGVWAECQRALGESLFLAFPTTVGAAAWLGSRSRAGGLDAMARHAVRSTLAIALREAIVVNVYAALGFLTVAATMFGLTAREASYGRIAVLPLVADVAMLCVATCLGLWTGRIGPWLLVVPAAGVACYVGLVFMVFVASDILSSLTPIDSRGVTTHSVPWWLHGLRAGFLLLVAWALTTFRAQRRRSGVGAAWLAGVVASPLLLIGTADRQPDDAAAEMLCTGIGTSVAVCMPQVKIYLDDAIREEYVRVQRALAPLLPDRVAVLDDEAAGTSRPAAAEAASVAAEAEREGYPVLRLSTFADISASAQLDRPTFDVALISIALPTRTADDDVSPNQALQRWAYLELDLPIDGSAAIGAPSFESPFADFSEVAAHVAWFARLTSDQRAVWLSEHQAEIGAESLTWQDFRWDS